VEGYRDLKESKLRYFGYAMDSHDLAHELLTLPAGPITVDYPTDTRDDEIAGTLVIGARRATYSGAEAVELTVG
jgi:hypothetical protein